MSALRGKAETWLTGIWYGRRGLFSTLFLPLAALYALVVAVRRRGYRHGFLRSEKLPVPVVVVGNVTTGGTGKTPFVIWLARWLGAQGTRVGVVSRGYGGSNVAPRLLTAADSAADVGDEPLLIAQATACPVAVGAQRAAAARLLLAEKVQVIIADDGLQHYGLGRDVEVVVLDGRRGTGNGLPLPSGPLREPRSRISEANLVVLNGVGGSEDCNWPGAVHMHIRPVAVIALGDEQGTTLAEWAGRKVHAVAGIGHPQQFFALLRAAGVLVIEHALADHARIREEDLAFDDDLPVLMTDKDAVKCTGIRRGGLHRVSIEAAFNAADVQRIAAVVCAPAG